MPTSPHLIAFDAMNWSSPTAGVREKRYKNAGQIIRLVEFSDGFIERDWCTKGHIGYVLEGSLTIDFNGKLVRYQKGSGIWIEEGVQNKHKAILHEGEKALLILFEKG